MSQEPRRVASGVAGLDTILNGGFIEGGLYIIQGPPGAGKTILANQICFARARSGGRALYVTVLAEAHSRMMLHLEALSFFDATMVPRGVEFVSAFSTLLTDGAKGLLDMLRRELRQQRASILIIDGFAAIEQSAGSDLEFKRFIHELQVQTSMVGCTCFLLTSSRNIRGFHPEHTMVDGLIELGDDTTGRRAEREMQVSKFRGSKSLRGRHAYEITDDGVTVHPRVEVLLRSIGPADEDSGTRLPAGNADIDRMFGGGLPRGTTTLVLGPSGAGKTTFGFTFLSQSAVDDPGLLFTFFETETRALSHAKRIGIDLGGARDRGALEVMWHSPTEHSLDALGLRLIENVKRRGVKRLVIDGLPGFQEAVAAPDRLPRFLAALFNQLRALGVTTLFTAESLGLFEQNLQLPMSGISAIAENLMLLRMSERRGELVRRISVIKVRGSAHDPHSRLLSITDNGIVVGEVASDHDVGVVTRVLDR